MTSRPTLDTFTMNGTTEPADDSHAFLDQAHGVLLALAFAIERREGRPNDEIIASAVRGAATLSHFAALSLAVCDHKGGRA